MKRAGKGGGASHREVVRPEATEDVTLSGALMRAGLYADSAPEKSTHMGAEGESRDSVQP